MAQKQIIWTSRAVQDKFSIYDYWIKRTRSNAYSLKLELLFNQTAQILSVFPQSGLSTSKNKIRLKTVKEFQIFYLTKGHKIVILTIWDTRQNPSKLKL